MWHDWFTAHRLELFIEAIFAFLLIFGGFVVWAWVQIFKLLRDRWKRRS